MQLIVKGKQLDVGESLRGHVAESLSAIAAKYFENIIEANVVFSREAHLFHTDLSLHVDRNVLLQSNASADDPYVAFDQAGERMAKRLRRYKRRLRDYHKDRPSEPAQLALAYVLEAEPEESVPEREGDEHKQPLIVAEMTTSIESLTVSEAVMRLDLGDLPALLFRNSAHGGLNMVYRRPDGNIGWVDPRGTRTAGA